MSADLGLSFGPGRHTPTPFGTLDKRASARKYRFIHCSGLRVIAPISARNVRTTRSSRAASRWCSLASLNKGRAVVSAFTADALTAEPKALAGIEFSAPRLAVGQLELSAANSVGQVALSDVAFSASSIRHSRDPYWEANGANVSVGTITAEIARIDSSTGPFQAASI